MSRNMTVYRAASELVALAEAAQSLAFDLESRPDSWRFDVGCEKLRQAAETFAQLAASMNRMDETLP